jgi:RNA polymerase sigma-70 factor (ECF subfamily)
VGRVRQALSTRLSRPEDVDDLAQEVYLRLLKAPRPDLIKNPQAYLYRIALNVAQEWRQRAAQALDHGGIVETLEAQEDPVEASATLEEDETVLQGIRELPPHQRSALILHVIDGLTYEEVADHMGVSRRAVKRYVANGYAALRERMETRVR